MRGWLLILCAVLSFSAFAQGLPFQQSGFESASVGYAVCDMVTGRIVCERNASIALTPASITKIITTATALELLGEDFRFETKLEYDGEITPQGVLKGNLYIKGGGDPSLGSYRIGDPNFLSTWVEIIRKKGIKHIAGSVVADASLFDTEGFLPKWIWEDIGNYYAAGVYALSAFDNTCRVTLSSGEEGTTPQILSIEPQIEGFCLENHLISKNIRSDSAYFYGAPLSNKRYLYGAVPTNKKSFIIKGDIPNPPLFVATELSKKLALSGIVVDEKPYVVFKTTANQRKLLYTNYSRKLAEIVKEINHRSNNFYAEHVLKYLALQKEPVATLNTAIYLEKKYWENKGISTDGLFLFDGSGLSPSNAVSPMFFVKLLSKMTQSAEFDTFYNSLPVAGESGTVSSFLLGSSLAGKVRVKSGSFSQVQCYAGYISKRYAFAVMVNNFSCPRKVVKREIEYLLEHSVLR